MGENSPYSYSKINSKNQIQNRDHLYMNQIRGPNYQGFEPNKNTRKR